MKIVEINRSHRILNGAEVEEVAKLSGYSDYFAVIYPGYDGKIKRQYLRWDGDSYITCYKKDIISDYNEKLVEKLSGIAVKVNEDELYRPLLNSDLFKHYTYHFANRIDVKRERFADE